MVQVCSRVEDEEYQCNDWTDADLMGLLDQWDEDEEPIPPDELPDFSKSGEETEEVSSLWQTVMFSFRDGAYAWETKDFLIEQGRVEDVQLEQKTHKGRYSEEERSDS